MTADVDHLVTAWIQAAINRHAQALTKPELLKAIRALSARYVERRADLARRSPIDSAGKRAAFAVFYAPLHLLTTLGIARRLDAQRHAAGRILDLGCGSGVAGAGWALAQQGPCAITGVDTEPWALEEARWNWRQLGLTGRTRRDDLVAALTTSTESGRPSHRHRRDTRGSASDAPSLLVFGWSINEIDTRSRARLLEQLSTHAEKGLGVLIIEPVATAVSPWWSDWAEVLGAKGARAETWRIDDPLPAALADMDEAAGFDREELTARSLWLAPHLGAKV